MTSRCAGAPTSSPAQARRSSSPTNSSTRCRPRSGCSATGAWRARCVGLDRWAIWHSSTARRMAACNCRRACWSPATAISSRSARRHSPPSPASSRRSGSPMAALFIDYGHTRSSLGDTLQAVQAHRHTDPLQSPGEADLTSQVDFAAFAAAMRAQALPATARSRRASSSGALGIIERASRLMAANPAKAAQIEADVARLMAPGGMGGRFQAIGIRSPQLPALPALEAVDTAPAHLRSRSCCSRSKPAPSPAFPASATGSSPASAACPKDLCQPQLRTGLGGRSGERRREPRPRRPPPRRQPRGRRHDLPGA